MRGKRRLLWCGCGCVARAQLGQVGLGRQGIGRRASAAPPSTTAAPVGRAGGAHHERGVGDDAAQLAGVEGSVIRALNCVLAGVQRLLGLAGAAGQWSWGTAEVVTIFGAKAVAAPAQVPHQPLPAAVAVQPLHCGTQSRLTSCGVSLRVGTVLALVRRSSSAARSVITSSAAAATGLAAQCRRLARRCRPWATHAQPCWAAMCLAPSMAAECQGAGAGCDIWNMQMEYCCAKNALSRSAERPSWGRHAARMPPRC